VIGVARETSEDELEQLDVESWDVYIGAGHPTLRTGQDCRGVTVHPRLGCA
jgi:hypothetical protein